MRESEFSYTQEARRIQSECGLFAAYLNDPRETDIRSILYQAGTDLQHRAEGAAGMWISNGENSEAVRELGRIVVAFQEGRNLPSVENAYLGMIHARYPTAGTLNHNANTQPLGIDGIWLGHHGNLTNALELESNLSSIVKGNGSPDSDTWIALNTIVKTQGGSLTEKVLNAQKKFEGSWALVVSDGKSLIASRDPHGIRPLFLGYLGSLQKPDGYLLSVESCAFHKLGVKEFREVLPGETIKIDETGEKTIELDPKEQMSCIFEFIYMMRPNSEFLGKDIYKARRRSGHILWEEASIKLEGNDDFIVMPVPNSGRPSALGYINEAKKTLGLRVAYDEGLLVDANFGRNFIKPTNGRAAKLKFYAIPYVFEEAVGGKSVVLVDDSIVRGDTIRDLAVMCRKAGAKEIHVRIASPPIEHPCQWGVAMQSYQKLLASNIPDIREREKFLNVESLKYLSLDGLVKAIGVSKDILCTYCLDGKGSDLLKGNVIPLFEDPALDKNLRNVATIYNS